LSQNNPSFFTAYSLELIVDKPTYLITLAGTGMEYNNSDNRRMQGIVGLA